MITPAAPLGAELERDLGGENLRHDPAELVGRPAPENEVVPLVVGRQMAQFVRRNSRSTASMSTRPS